MTAIFGNFEWDSNKNEANKEKHWIAFEEASQIFEGPARAGRIRIISARAVRKNEREIYHRQFGDTS